MKSIPKRKKTMIFVAASGLLSMALGVNNANALSEATPEMTDVDVNAKAEQYEVVEPKGAVAALTKFNINDTSFLKDNGITVSGNANAGITYNGNNPTNGYNGPVTFGDRSSEFQLNQLNLSIQKAVATEGDKWSFGGRFDAMFGTDSIFTQAYGVPAFNPNSPGQPLSRNNWDLNILGTAGNRFYGIALPQAYLETYVPVGNGLDVKLGHFYTPIGYETVPANENFFYTHAYTMQYGEPFTHTGALGNYAFSSNWSAMGGVTTGSATGGWDGGFNQQLSNWSGIGGVTWTSTDKGSSANVSGTYGAASSLSSHAWAMYSIVLKHNFTDKTHFILQHDHGFANAVYGADGTIQDAEWYGVNSHLYYDIKDNLSIGMRAEWFRDQNGFRVAQAGRIGGALNGSGYSYAGQYYGAAAASYYELTWGVNWKPVAWLNLRPNVRYDRVDGTQAGSAYTPFGGKTDQVLFSNDFIVTF